jgi:phage terminase small subunit
MRRPPPDPEPLLARLNDRQRIFALAYCRRGHATESAAGAGYRWPDKQGSRLKTFPAVRAAIEALLERHRWELEREQEVRWRERWRQYDAILKDPNRRRPRRRKPIGGR